MMQKDTDRPKVLILTLNSSYPLTHGGAIGQYYVIDGLKDRVDFVYCTIVRTKKALEDLRLFQRAQPTVRIYYDTAWERSGLRRIKSMVKFCYRSVKLLLLRLLRGEIFKKHDREYHLKDDFLNEGINSINTPIDAQYIQLIDRVIKDENIKQVQMDFFETMCVVFMLPPDIKKIFMCHELRYERLQMGFADSLLPAPYKNLLIERMRFYEEALIRKMDCVITLNEDETQKLEKINNNVRHINNAIPDELIYKKEASKTFTRLVFVAGEDHMPNAHGLQWFLDAVYVPNRKDIPFSLNIIGKWSKQFRKKYAKYKQIVFCGFVDSLEPYYENAILISPILIGAGIRMKILHAMANKIPVFTTRFGATGCYTEKENAHLAFFDSPEEFVRGINAVDNAFLENLALAGNAYYNTAFNKEILLQKRMEVYLAPL